MISYPMAKKLIKASIPRPESELLPLMESLGCVLAQSVRSSIDTPTVNNSAMDGFALKASDLAQAAADNPIRLKITGTIKAGDVSSRLMKGCAMKIMTGACIPRGSDTILAKELAVMDENMLVVSQPVQCGMHVRHKGEEIRKGNIAVSRYQVIDPGVVGFLSGLGVETIAVFKKPRITLISTGSELAAPGQTLHPGQIFDSNRQMLSAALMEMKIKPVREVHIHDDRTLIGREFKNALGASDILIITGGVSVGDYDYVKEQLGELSVESIFWKVKQKPGKPLYFGKKGSKLVFGLPGNPASAFICFYEYVYPAILQFMGHRNCELESAHIPLKHTIRNRSDRLLFLKCQLMDRKGEKTARILSHQKSHMLSSLCQTNALAVLRPKRKVEAGREILVHHLPFALSRMSS